MLKLTIFTDGASRGNPGQASYGFTITDEHKQVVFEEGRYIGVTTNNVAEYSAILAALEYISSNINPRDIEEIKFFMDSNLAAQQLSGRFKIKSPHLSEIIFQIKNLEKLFSNISYQHVPRALNKRADALANIALDSLQS